MNEPFTAYITKYALTTGIHKVDDAKISTGSPSTIMTNALGGVQWFHGEGRNWHRTLASANAKALSMRMKMIMSLRHKIAKLEAMKF